MSNFFAGSFFSGGFFGRDTSGGGKHLKDERYEYELRELYRMQLEFQQEQQKRVDAQTVKELPAPEIVEVRNEVRAKFSSVIEGARINLGSGKAKLGDLRKETALIKKRLKILRKMEEFYRQEEKDILWIARRLDD